MNHCTERGTHRPYLVVAAFPGRMPQTVARTYNRSDAEAHVRFLQQRIKQASFYAVFDPESHMLCYV